MNRTAIASRVGVALSRSRPDEAIEQIRRAEAAGVGTAWTTMSAGGYDVLTTCAVAAARTERIVLGTSIVPAFTKHPLGLATQALAIDAIAPGRLRLGIGTSHGPMMQSYGFAPDHPLRAHPLEWLREYTVVARTAIQEGRVSFHGDIFTAEIRMAAAAPIPVLISALRPNAWELAGEVSDGGISWICPVDYLIQEALPAMQRGADRAGRERPPLVAHVPVALSADLNAVRAAAGSRLAGYARLPFYRKMFEAAGYPLGDSEGYSDDLLDHLIVSGDDQAVVDRLTTLLDQGFDELLVMLIPVEDQATEEDRLLRLIGEMGEMG